MVCDYAMRQLSTPCSKVTREVLSTNGCGRPFQIRIVSGKKECLYSCAMAYGTMNLDVWPLVVVADVCNSVGGIPTRLFTILYIIVAFIRDLLSVKVGHWRVCSIDVTLLVCW